MLTYKFLFTSNTHLQLWGPTLKQRTRVVAIYASNDNYYICRMKVEFVK